MTNLKDKKYLESLIKSYDKKEDSKIDQLRELDKKAKRGANVFAYVFGSIGALILGIGMCLGMQVFTDDFLPQLNNCQGIGIVIGIVGIVLVTVNYFIYKKLLENGKNKYSQEILSLSKALLNE